MRQGNRVRWVLGGLAMGSAIAAWVACSSDPTPAIEPTPDASTTADTGAQQDTGGPPVDSGTEDAAKDAGRVYDAGPPIVLDGGPEGGVPCVLGGVLEDEPNDDRATANTVDPTRCGVLVAKTSDDAGADGGDAGDAGAGTESDFLTFTLKPTTKSFYIQFAGDISMKVDVEGQPSVIITPTSAPPVAFVQNKPYYIEVRSLNGKPTNWRVTVFQDP